MKIFSLFLFLFFLCPHAHLQHTPDRILFNGMNDDGSSYRIYMKEPSSSRPKVAKKTNIKHLEELPNKWVPLYLYHDTLCTYKPCDGIFVFHIIRKKNELFWVNFEENNSLGIGKLNNLSTNQWEIVSIKGLENRLIAKIKRTKEGFIMCHENTLYIDVNSLIRLPRIINDCTTQKHIEFQELDVATEDQFLKIDK